MNRLIKFVLVTVFILAIINLSLFAAEEKLVASDGSAGDNFGFSVGISSTVAVVGAPNYVEVDQEVGAVYIYELSGGSWQQTDNFMSTNIQENGYFGGAVDISGNYAIVGSRSGDAYIYDRSLDELSYLWVSGVGEDDRYGWDVAIDGDYAIIGASMEDQGDLTDAGAAHIFMRDGENWSYQARLIPDDFDEFYRFGYSVDITDEYAVIGALGVENYMGAAYVFERDGETWTQQAKVTPINGSGGDYFGISSSISGTRFIIGASAHDTNELQGAGQAYIYQYTGSTWTFVDTLIAEEPAEGDGFGGTVCIEDDYAIVGASGDDVSDIGADAGAAYVYKLEGGFWFLLGSFKAGDIDAGDSFGKSVAISNNKVIAGATMNDDEGAAYVYDVPASYLNVSPDSILVLGAGDESFDVSNPSTVQMDWTATPYNTWLNIVSGSPGVDDGTVIFSYDHNFNFSRIGEIRVVGDGALNSPQIVKIYQDGGYKIELNVADANGNDVDLAYGATTSSGEGYDPNYDQYAPPPMPVGAFDARFSVGGEDYIQDYRDFDLSLIEWDLYYQPSTGGDPITLTWDNTTFPPGVFLLQDPIDGSLINIDMSDQNYYIVADPGTFPHLKILYYAPYENEIGWNMIGLPLDSDETNYAILYPDAVPNTLYEFISGSYFSATNLQVGTGYWLKFYENNNAEIIGEPIEEVVLPLSAGWSIIAGPSCDVGLTYVSDPGSIIVPNTLYGYESGYYLSTNIEQGEGYWIKTYAAGTITISCGNRASDELFTEIDTDSWSKIRISDSANAEQILYYDLPEEPEMKESYSLPPLPPAKLFDARFEDDYYITEKDESVIQIQTSNYPVTLEFSEIQNSDQYEYTISQLYADIEIATETVEEGKIVVIDDPLVERLLLKKNGGSEDVSVPPAIAVHPNYPNPFNPITTIKYELPEKAQVSLRVYDVSGKLIRTLIHQETEAGIHKAIWNGKDDNGRKVASGLYFYRFESEDFSETHKMIMLK
jgi:hypothetical protein